MNVLGDFLGYRILVTVTTGFYWHFIGLSCFHFLSRMLKWRGLSGRSIGAIVWEIWPEGALKGDVLQSRELRLGTFQAKRNRRS
jgi:hypothetical protein